MSKKNRQQPQSVSSPVSKATTANGVDGKITGFSWGSFIEKKWPIFLLLVGLVLLVYINAINNGLISDDKGLQTEGDNLVKFSYIFSDPLSIVRSILYAFIYTIGGVTPALFRSLNIIFHIGNVLLVFTILSLLMRKEVAFFASVLFAVHPILVEAVTWISGGPYSQYSFFFLLSFLFYILKEKDRKYFWASLGFYLIALLSSNRVMSLALILLVYEFVFGDLKKNWKFLIPYFFLSFIWGLYYVAAIGPRAAEVQKASNADSLTYNPFFQLPFSITGYLELMFWPDQLSFYHSDIDIPGWELALRWLVLLIFFGIATWGLFKKRFVFFWISFFVIGLLINLTPFSIAWLVAERYVYLSTIGIFALVGYLFYKFSKINKNTYYAAYIVFFLIVAVLSVRTIVRNFDWKDEDTLMTSTLRTNPENAKVHNHLGIIHGKKKDYVNAMKEFEIAMQLDPNLAETYHNMGNAFDEQARAIRETDLKKYEEFTANAIPLYEKAVSLDPKHWMSYQQLANIYFDRGDFLKTADYIQRILPINPNPALLTNLGVVYLKAAEKDPANAPKLKETAKSAFQEALRLDPSNTFAQAAVQDINNPNLLAPAPDPNQPPAEENPAMPGGQLPPEVLKAIQEQTQKASSAPQP